ncbi:MAG: 7-carboxy-7-deazaguanine synthase QueE [Gammaproteobacteria bacterium]
MAEVLNSEVAATERLKITEIFLSLQGEATTAGWPTVFVRLTGCPLRCVYCDTAYAFHGGAWMSLDDIVASVSRHGVRHVCVTGGEPLAQRNCPLLVSRLCDAGMQVSIETSGAFDVSMLDPRAQRILDLKTPGSGEEKRNLWQNLDCLRSDDVIKFVICNLQDYQWARDVIRRERLDARCNVFLSPSWGQQDAAELGGWLLADRLPARLQLQLHKMLWGDQPGR